MTKDIKILNSENGEFYGDFNDITIGPDGDIVTVEGQDKLAQDVVKILFTLKGSSPLFLNYGTQITGLINSRNTDNLEDALREEVIYALSYVQKSNENEAINIAEIVTANIAAKDREIDITLVLKLTNGETLKVNA